MHIGQLPPGLRDIHDDGRSSRELLDALEKKHVALFARHLFECDSNALLQSGTPYHFLATVAGELPNWARLNPDQAFSAATKAYGQIGKPSLRSILFLMERMAIERLWADIFVMSEAVDDDGDPAFVQLGYEHDEGVPWLAAVPASHVFKFDSEMILFLA